MNRHLLALFFALLLANHSSAALLNLSVLNQKTSAPAPAPAPAPVAQLVVKSTPSPIVQSSSILQLATSVLSKTGILNLPTVINTKGCQIQVIKAPKPTG